MMWMFKDWVLIAAVLGTTLPFFSMATILLFTRDNGSLSSRISIAAVSISFTCAIYLLYTLHAVGGPVQYQTVWLSTYSFQVTFGYLLDPLSLIMLMIVATISFLVQIYSVGYMAGDPGFSRYYAFQSLFAWAMMNMVIAPSLLQLFIFWELVGLASYLLIGFYYEKWSASQAGKKAFVMTRVGDVGFFLGLIILLIGFGNLGILDVNAAAAQNAIAPWLVTVSAILIFCGVVGKSAQFPLLTWLPDAMEGPTPVSALLHSATMVAAGVYMFSRIFPFFAASPDAMTVALIIGTITMLLSSTMAMATYDLKQVWAYSTVSQLGLMVMGLGAGGYFAGVFHLTTHAGFKALLFLCSGIFIHEFHSNDMREIGRKGGRKLIIPMVCMTIGALSLSGLFPFSGFFSKEAILGVLANQPNKLWLIAALTGALMTAYYSFRLIFHLLFPRKADPSTAPAGDHDEDHSHAEHDSGHKGYVFWTMAVPVMALAGVTLVIGFFQSSIENYLTGGIGHSAGHAAVSAGSHAVANVATQSAHGGGHQGLLIIAVSVALAGIVWSWLEFGRKSARQEGFLRYFPALRSLFEKRWYMDGFLRRTLDRVVYGGFTSLFTRNDRRIIDGGIDAICFFTIAGGRVFSFLQSGRLQQNLLIMVAVVGLAMLYFLI